MTQAVFALRREANSGLISPAAYKPALPLATDPSLGMTGLYWLLGCQAAKWRDGPLFCLLGPAVPRAPGPLRVCQVGPRPSGPFRRVAAVLRKR